MPDYNIIIQYDEQNHIYVASVPQLQGCMAHGYTQEKALKEVLKVKEMWLDTAREKKMVIPNPVKYI